MINHAVRAKGIVGRAFPKRLFVRGLKRAIDVSAWHEDIARDVARGLRQVEREAHAHAIRSAANLVGELGLGDRELNLKIVRQILTLEKPKGSR